MAKPWEEYQEANSQKPWEEYQVQPAKEISQANFDPTEGNSFGQNALIGAGKAFVDAGRGTGQMLRSVLPESFADNIGLPTEQSNAEARKLDEPLMNTVGGNVGNIGGNVAMALPTAFIPGANTYTGGAVAGAVMGAVQPTVQGESRLENTGKGAAAGIIAKFVSDRAF